MFDLDRLAETKVQRLPVQGCVAYLEALARPGTPAMVAEAADGAFRGALFRWSHRVGCSYPACQLDALTPWAEIEAWVDRMPAVLDLPAVAARMLAWHPAQLAGFPMPAVRPSDSLLDRRLDRQETVFCAVFVLYELRCSTSPEPFLEVLADDAPGYLATFSPNLPADPEWLAGSPPVATVPARGFG